MLAWGRARKRAPLRSVLRELTKQHGFMLVQVVMEIPARSINNGSHRVGLQLGADGTVCAAAPVICSHPAAPSWWLLSRPPWCTPGGAKAQADLHNRLALLLDATSDRSSPTMNESRCRHGGCTIMSFSFHTRMLLPATWCAAH
jgi:hypothetical protein